MYVCVQVQGKVSDFCGNCTGTSQPQPQPCKKRRYDDSVGAGANETVSGQSRTVIQCSNGNLSRVHHPEPASSKSGSSMSRLSSSSSSVLRGTSGGSAELENYNDIRPDILEMIKEEQKVKSTSR